jgi:hypothetical protein
MTRIADENMLANGEFARRYSAHMNSIPESVAFNVENPSLTKDMDVSSEYYHDSGSIFVQTVLTEEESDREGRQSV